VLFYLETFLLRSTLVLPNELLYRKWLEPLTATCFSDDPVLEHYGF